MANSNKPFLFYSPQSILTAVELKNLTNNMSTNREEDRSGVYIADKR
jgi:hypothetical protein